VESLLEVVARHLLKWIYQPVRRAPSWRTRIRNARQRLAPIVEDSVTLRQVPMERLAVIYQRTRRGAVDEPGLPLSTFPETCPWTVEQLLDDDFLPEA
jgi:hypothetical protein